MPFAVHTNRRSPLPALALVASLATPVGAAAAEVATVDLRGLEARSAALLLSGQQTGELAASFLARPLAATATAEPILLVADIVGASLLEGAGGAETILEVYAYALADGQPRATLSRAFRIDLAAHRALLETGGVKFLGELAPPAGARVEALRLLVLHRASGRFALRTVPLAATAGDDDRIDRPPPLLLEPAASWLVADAAERRWPTGLVPATRLTAGNDELEVTLGHGASPSAPVARLLDAAGEPLAALAVEAAPGPSAAPATSELLLDLSATAPGTYLLEIGGGAAGPAARLPLEIRPGPLATGTPWFHRPPAAEEEEVVAATADAPPAGRSALAAQALESYRRAFEGWLEGDLDRAAAELQRFETGAIHDGAGAAKELENALVRAAAEMAARDAEVLVPLMCLHERLFRLYRASDRLLLASHARRMALEFARLHAQRGGREAKRLAALVPVSVAGARQELGSRNGAQVAFEHALELDPGQPEALLGLAALHESFAHYEITVELLRRHGRRRDLPADSRLRLAINLDRVGSTRPAMDHLRELLEAQPEWVSRLAHQELARLLADGGRGDEAVALLGEARRRYPEDQRLIIQQAALLDALGKPLAGQRVLAELDEVSGDPGDSPRLRYSTLPSGQIEAARARLSRAARERLAGVLERAGDLRAGAAP